tara:strand:- start:719 stop:1558 length:840 start_codon:yes stop_codon:yes gene_type:complete
MGGARKSNSSPASSGVDQSGDGPLSFSTPTEFVELPSEGAFYGEGHPLQGETHIEIRHMTAKDEDILSSRSLLKQGVAIDRLLKNIIVNKKITTEEIYVGDKNAILVAARISGYGEEYQTKVVCPSCVTHQEAEFDLSLQQIYTGDDFKDFNITPTGDGTFMVGLPALGLDVEVRLLTGKEESYLLKLSENKKKKKLPEATTTDQFKIMIVSVQGKTDSKSISGLVENMPAKDSRYLRSAYDCICPNVDLKQHFICSTCGYETEELEVPFTTDFFWPKR